MRETSAQAAPPQASTSGAAMHALMERLYPLCRSITGDGVRQTLAILSEALEEHVPLRIEEVPTGMRVLDWHVPKEWNLRDAYLLGPDGEPVVDFRASNLHVVSYSVPMRKRLTLESLKPHLHTLPEHPTVIPYRTSYYRENWGFCMPHRQYEALEEGEYEVIIDSTLQEGTLTFGECYLPGVCQDEVLISCYICHPSMCNDNLSGVVLTTFLARMLAERTRRYSYRLLFIPETIGAITWLALNREAAGRVRHGLVATCVGDQGPFTYKRSRRGDAPVDRAAEYVLRTAGSDFEVLDFFPTGSDERQYCSPGFNLPVGSLMRTPYGRFPEYHTSADDLDFVRPASLQASLEMYMAVLDILEHDRTYINTSPYGEPQLGRRNLYRSLGGPQRLQGTEEAMLWLLNLSDGTHGLLDVAERSGLPFTTLRAAVAMLKEHNLLQEQE